jgi:hypothetical protein
MDRLFQVNFNDEIRTLTKTEVGVPQVSIVGPVLQFICTNDLPTSDNTTTATFADDTAIVATCEDPATASMKPKSPSIRLTIGRINGELK